ncbi:MAG: hypothetical protein QGF59_14990 [Pirellulaceae bacterium]|nr:hypothetical protein [Pirellulaceae bacterium]
MMDVKKCAEELREFSLLLSGEPLKMTIDGRSIKLSRKLNGLRQWAEDSDNLDLLKTVQCTLSYMSIDGRSAHIEGAIVAAQEINEEHGNDAVKWQEISQLPNIDRAYMNRTADLLREFARRLDKPLGGNSKTKPAKRGRKTNTEHTRAMVKYADEHGNQAAAEHYDVTDAAISKARKRLSDVDGNHHRSNGD